MTYDEILSTSATHVAYYMVKFPTCDGQLRYLEGDYFAWFLRIEMWPSRVNDVTQGICSNMGQEKTVIRAVCYATRDVTVQQPLAAQENARKMGT